MTPPDPPSAKTCAKCGETKPVEEFHRSSGTKDGLHAYCKPCNVENVTAHRKARRRGVPGRARGQEWVIGDTFGDLTVTGFTQPSGLVKLLECRCTCGGAREVWANNVAVMASWDCGDKSKHPKPPRPPKPPKKDSCPDCGGPKSIKAKTCKPCAAKRRRIRADNDQRIARNQRESDAPGLTQSQRNNLLHTWQRQHRTCTYCGIRQADTIDHVIPLIRGGDSYEGNLAPACRACNSMKGGKLLAEWKLNIRLKQQQEPTTWQWRPRPKRATEQPRIKPITGEQSALFKVCPGCGGAYIGKAAYCSARCSSRTKYRLKVGIPARARLGTRAA